MSERSVPQRNLRDDLRADWAANRGNPKGRVVVGSYRIVRHLHVTASPLARPAAILHRLVVDWVMGIELPPTVVSGPGLQVWHGTGLVVHRDSSLGFDVILRHGVTLGTVDDDDSGLPPTLGDRVSVGAGAILLGPIDIGDDAVIGAGSVVIRDVPPGATVVGNPARALPPRAVEDRTGSMANGATRAE